MPLEAIYVVRHGFRTSWTVNPATGKYSSAFRSPTGLPTDPALTSHGVEQSNELATHLIKIDSSIDQVYSSPYYRCLQTVLPFVSQRQTQIETSTSPFGIRVETGLSEWYGAANFEHPTSAPLSGLKAFFPCIDSDYKSSISPSRYGESVSRLHERIASCIRAIITRSDREGHKAVLVCTHAAVVIALGRILTGEMPDDPDTEDFKAFTCGLSVYRRQLVTTGPTADSDKHEPRGEYEKEALADDANMHDGDIDHARNANHAPWKPPNLAVCGGWLCEANSECSFLRLGEERGWKFSGDESFVDFGQQESAPLDSKARVDDETAEGGNKAQRIVVNNYKL